MKVRACFAILGAMLKVDYSKLDSADMTPKPVKDSVVVTRDIVHPSDVNAYGVVFGGYMMSLLDKAACIAAFTHAGMKVSTVAMDGVRFYKPAVVGTILTIRASVNRVFGSSMEIGLRVTGILPGVQDEEELICRAYMTFVAIGKDEKPVLAAPVVPETPDEIRRYEEALARRESRIALKNSLESR